MAVQISGALINGAGIPMSGCHIILKSRVNTSEVIMRTIADVVTGNNGEYSFEAQTGKYCVYLKQDWRDEYCVGDISVYDDSKPGTLNDFLTALDEGDLKPDVVKRFEELVAQAQQSAEEAAQHASDAEKTKESVEAMAKEVQQNADATAADRIATEEYVRQSAQNAAASAQSAQEAKGYRDGAEQIVGGLMASNATTTQKGLVQLSNATDSDSEELAATPKAVKTVMDEVQTKAPLDSPVFSGTPTTPTPADDAAGLEMANAAFVRKLIAALVGSSPEALDTLNELAAALGNDPNFATTVTNALAGKQPLNEILTSLSGLTTAGNKLAYFSDKNVMALANLSAVGRALIGQNTKSEALDYLGLKSAATKDVQTDIYDRTEGRVAIPGAFGYGSLFFGGDSIQFNTSGEFTDWIRTARPGRYCVEANTGVVIPGVLFYGLLEVIWPSALASNYNPLHTAKIIIFYGVNGEIYYARGNTGLIGGWEKLKLKISDFIAALSSRTGSTSSGDPDVGGLILAAYQGKEDGDTQISMTRGYAYPGSSLTPLSISIPNDRENVATATPSITTRGCGGWRLPGVYIALSGASNVVRGQNALVGLFIRHS